MKSIVVSLFFMLYSSFNLWAQAPSALNLDLSLLSEESYFLETAIEEGWLRLNSCQEDEISQKEGIT